MKVNEIFYSLQGEGKNTGLPTVFIRLTGCNLRCSFCDTKYAYYTGKELEIPEIIEKTKKYNCKNICITGGEPLLQKNVTILIDKLIEKNYNVCLETNGSYSIKNILDKNNLMISLDIKCPSSNMQDKMDYNNIQLLKEKDQLKFIIKNKKDYNYAKKIIEKHKPKCTVYLQPVWGTDPRKIAEWIKKDCLNVRLGLQLHKIIWGEKRRK